MTITSKEVDCRVLWGFGDWRLAIGDWRLAVVQMRDSSAARQSDPKDISDPDRRRSATVIGAGRCRNRVVVVECGDALKWWTELQARFVVVESPTNGACCRTIAAVNEEGAA
jgi:hypothetical protein